MLYHAAAPITLQPLTRYLRFLYILAYFPFAASEMERDYYHQKFPHELPND